MKVSIIISCYNDFEYIEQSVLSAYNQTYSNKEIIVVDDGSDSKTKNKLKELSLFIDLLITQPNKGQSSARNKAIENASGKYILILDSDDYWEPDFLELALPEFEKSSVSLVTCWARCFDKNDEWIYKPKGGSLKNFLFENASVGNALFRKEDFKKIGGYDEDMRLGWEDWEFFIRLMNLGGICKVIPIIFFNYRKRENTTTSIANKNRYDLYRYIFTKNSQIYKTNFSSTVDFLTDKLIFEEKERMKNLKRTEYILGYNILKPYRAIKKKFRE